MAATPTMMLGETPYSHAKEKSARGVFLIITIMLFRIRQLMLQMGSRVRRHVFFSCILLGILFFFVAFRIGFQISAAADVDLGVVGLLTSSDSSASSSSSRASYTVLINTWKRYSLLKQTVAHYASCRRVNAVHVVWSESDPPPDSLKNILMSLVESKSHSSGNKVNFRFNINEEDNLNNRFKPIKDLATDAIFSIDDDVIVPCRTLDFAFSVWQSAPDAMVGFVPRMHWLVKEKDGVMYYNYGGWWSIWWTGTYSMVLSKAAFFHRKYLDLYTYNMPSSIHEYVARERNCEDIAMSLLVSNATGAPPIWVKGKIYEIGSSGISSLKGHSERRSKCVNDFVSLYGTMPLVPTNLKAVDSRGEWFW